MTQDVKNEAGDAPIKQEVDDKVCLKKSPAVNFKNSADFLETKRHKIFEKRSKTDNRPDFQTGTKTGFTCCQTGRAGY